MSSPKYRDYFLTINKSAECFPFVLDIVKELNISLYAYIEHDKDILIEKDENGCILEKPKELHKHAVIELKNPITFNSMRKKFVGAHIEIIKYKKASYQYLLHQRPKALEKYQYDFNEIITNNVEAVKQAIQSEEGIRLFRENEFMLYIAEGIVSPYQFTKTFGLNVYKQYWKPYSDMLETLKHDTEMQNDLEMIKLSQSNETPF